MLIEKLIFNVVAFSLFVFIFFKMIRKNDTTYVTVLVIEAIGILLNFIEIFLGLKSILWLKIIMYLMAIIVPVIVILVEKRGINFSESLVILEVKLIGITGNTKLQKDLLAKMVKRYPESYIGHKMLGAIYEKEGGMRKAIDEYVQAIEINNKDYETYYNISFLLNELGQKDESIVMLNNLLKVKPDHFNAMQLLGDVLCSQEKYKDALSVYTNMLKYYPDSYEAYYNMGMAYSLLTDFANAKICFEKAAEINSMLYHGYYSLGQINMIYGDLNDAEVYFQKCLLEKETEAGAYYNLAKIAMLKGDKDKALQYVNIAIETDNKYSKIADEEPVFIPIKVAIRFNYDEVKNEEPENLTENEIRVRKYLDRTYYVSGDISKKDLYLARASKEDIENARREKLEKGFEQDEEYSEDFENEIDTNDEIKEEKNEIEEQKEKEE